MGAFFLVCSCEDMPLHEYQVIGRLKPTADVAAPTMYRMRIFSPNEVVAKSRFWYFLSKYHKMKKTTGEILTVNEIFEKSPSVVKNYGLSFDMIVALVPITFTKNSVILLVLALFLNFTWIWLEDTELEPEASKLLMLRKLPLKTANDHTLLSSMIPTLNSHSLIEFKEQVNVDIKEDSDLQDHPLFGKQIKIIVLVPKKKKKKKKFPGKKKKKKKKKS